jgi:hypothetical protein
MKSNKVKSKNKATNPSDDDDDHDETNSIFGLSSE